MKKLSRLFPILIFLFLFVACNEEPRPYSPSSMPVVVEGWIEEGESPIVIITRAVDLTRPMDSLENYVEKWWRVSVDNGTERYYLTARLNKNYIPSFVYTTSRLKGRVGVDYRLIIETEDTVITATTSILPHVPLDSLKVSGTANCDTLWQINAFIGDTPQQDIAHYKFFTRVVNRERRFYSSFLGTFERSAYNPTTGYSVAKGIHSTFSQQFSPYYQRGDTVDVKLCTLSSEQYVFWIAYENAVSLSGNSFFNVAHGCPTNIEGAIGYWFGYGVSMRRVIIR